MQLDNNNIEFQRAYRLITQTDRNVFLTGRAGTGKTTFLKYLKEHCKKSMAIVAPTGVAAINAGGVTINSFFQIKPGFNAPDAPPAYNLSPEKESVIRGLKLLVIDEISMVRCDMLEMVDKTCRYYGNRALPFGGKQVLLIGDPFQLPSFVSDDEEEVFFKFYNSVFFFKSNSFWSANPVPIELKKIYRQNDRSFIELLNKVRVNEVNDADIEMLNRKVVGPNYPFAEEEYLCLGTKNNPVKIINQTELVKLPTSLHQLKGQIQGNFSLDQLPTDLVLDLKEGAQVMFVKNDAGGGKRYYNGKLGTIQKIRNDQIEVSFPEGGSTLVGYATWEKIKYEWDEETKKVTEKIDGTFIQFPLKLAWAITVHKSQGLSLERVFADVGESWDSGQVYVALSRCTTFEGLKLAKAIPRSAIRVAPEVHEFYKWVIDQTSQQDQPPKIVYFKSDKTLLTGPGEITIEWEISGAQRISLAGRSNLPAKGSITVHPKKERLFELVAENEWGIISKKTLEIQVKDTPPVIHRFATDRIEITDRRPVRLSWNVDGAEKIEISGIGDVSGKDGIDFFTNKDIVITLRAESYFGTHVTKSIGVSVSKLPPIIEEFASDEQYILKGMPVTLFWKVIHAERIEISPIKIEQKSSSGSHSITLYESTVFKLTAWTLFGIPAQKTLTIHTIPVPVIESLWVPGISIDTKLDIKIERPVMPDFGFADNQRPSLPLVNIEISAFNQPSIDTHSADSARRFPDFKALLEEIRNQLQNLIEKIKK